MSFADFKKAFQGTDKSEKIKNFVKLGSSDYTDERFWDLSKDSKGNGEALIRFLPLQDTTKEEAVKVYSHFFQENGKKFYTLCPKTNGWEEECFACDFAQKFWDKYNESKSDDDKKIAGNYGRKVRFISNILVVNDPKKPENNGKVFLFNYGITIYNKIQHFMNPDSEIREPKYPFDPFEGYNFIFSSTKKSGYANYENSEFEKDSSSIADFNVDVEEVYNGIRSLDEFLENCKKVDNEKMTKDHLKTRQKSKLVKEKDSDLGENDENQKIPEGFKNVNMFDKNEKVEEPVKEEKTGSNESVNTSEPQFNESEKTINVEFSVEDDVDFNNTDEINF